MSLKWIDSLEIAIALDELHPEVDPTQVNFVDLRDWVMALEEFDDDPQHSGERMGPNPERPDGAPRRACRHGRKDRHTDWVLGEQTHPCPDPGCGRRKEAHGRCQ